MRGWQRADEVETVDHAMKPGCMTVKRQGLNLFQAMVLMELSCVELPCVAKHHRLMVSHRWSEDSERAAPEIRGASILLNLQPRSTSGAGASRACSDRLVEPAVTAVTVWAAAAAAGEHCPVLLARWRAHSVRSNGSNGQLLHPCNRQLLNCYHRLERHCCRPFWQPLVW